MSFELLGVTAVVLGEGLDPVKLQPAFLQLKNIVPPSWEPSEPPIVLPVASRVVYEGRFIFQMQPGKFQGADRLMSNPPEQSPLAGYVSRFLEETAPANLAAVGVNIDGFIRCANPDNVLRTLYLKEDNILNSSSQVPVDFSFRTAYAVDGAKLGISVDPGTVTPPNQDEVPSILIKANYHSDLQAKTVAEAVSLLGRFRERCDYFMNFAEKFTEEIERSTYEATRA